MSDLDSGSVLPNMLATMAKRKRPTGRKMARVFISYRTSPAVLEAIEAFAAAYNRQSPGAALNTNRAVDMLVRESLRHNGHQAADEIGGKVPDSKSD